MVNINMMNIERHNDYNKKKKKKNHLKSSTSKVLKRSITGCIYYIVMKTDPRHPTPSP